MELEYLFTRRELLKILCKKRCLLAKKEHDRQFYKNILVKSSHAKQHELYEIFPPRNTWIRLRKSERSSKNATQINSEQLERTVLLSTKRLTKFSSTGWQSKLLRFIDEIISKALSSSYSIPKPKIISHFKEKKNGIKVFRPIAHFEYVDRIIISQLNKYLTYHFDRTFENCSYAFRSRASVGKSFSHHGAVEDIIEFKRKNNKKNLFVAECDIKKFYDCVNHAVVRSHFYDKVSILKRNGTIINQRALDLFESYLKCYSFNKDVLSINLGKDCEFGWVDEIELRDIQSDPSKEEIGVPQGGAISCFIANLLMDYVDKKVLSYDDKNLFYARFCDDMVLIHTKKKISQEILNVYGTALKDIKLLHHNFTTIKYYDKDFWKSKSKSSYKWGDPALSNKNVPWLSFVGYQIKFDLKIRVRKSSIKNEILKQLKETDKIIEYVKTNKKFKVSERAIKYRITQRLLSMSVGRKSIFNPKKEGQMCWSSGFRVLKQNDNVKYQLRHLDKKRGKQLARLDRIIKNMNKNNRPDKNRKVLATNETKYYGAPFSYYFQLNTN